MTLFLSGSTFVCVFGLNLSGPAGFVYLRVLCSVMLSHLEIYNRITSCIDTDDLEPVMDELQDAFSGAAPQEMAALSVFLITTVNQEPLPEKRKLLLRALELLDGIDECQ